ncbi:thrombospondin type 3 repeat-containing protein [Promethearchaeum syntrophicum]|uniref:Thrombospondin type 3 repeat-containing protein n=1 Tax=Promethearchaeum syntrophicum TaxID=2594042 RepID=A0A5B9DAL0_9ARCH|nr:thrombospondin type 3 repeat-containing protein [Candidatus Prometheoarchaeum syntrophicum]
MENFQGKENSKIQNNYENQDILTNSIKRLIYYQNATVDLSYYYYPSDNFIWDQEENAFYSESSDLQFENQLPFTDYGFELNIIACKKLLSSNASISFYDYFKRNVYFSIFFSQIMRIEANSEKCSKSFTILYDLNSDYVQIRINFHDSLLNVWIEGEKYGQFELIDFAANQLNTLNISANLSINAMNIYSYINDCQEQSNPIYNYDVLVNDFLIKNAYQSLNFQNEDGSFKDGFDAYNKSGYSISITSMEIIKSYYAFLITHDNFLLESVNKSVNYLTNKSFLINTSFGLSYGEGTSLINDLARPLIGLVYIGIFEDRLGYNNFPNLVPFLDDIVQSIIYNETMASILNVNEWNSQNCINQQFQASTVIYLWAMTRNFTNVHENHRKLIHNFLVQSQNDDGSWNYFANYIGYEKKPLSFVYNIHILFSFTMIKFFFPNDPIFSNSTILASINQFIQWIEYLLPSFAYNTNYYGDIKLNIDYNYEKEFHHILGFAGIRFFDEFLNNKSMKNLPFQMFYDNFLIKPETVDYREGILSSNSLIDALSYRMFLFFNSTELYEIHISDADRDADGDGLLDGDEVSLYYTSPFLNDTDGDGLLDGDEVFLYYTLPLLNDTDGDGLLDGDEVFLYYTLPLLNDTDGDGLLDGEEVLLYFTSPLLNDTDGDGLLDGDEVLIYKTNPCIKESFGTLFLIFLKESWQSMIIISVYLSLSLFVLTNKNLSEKLKLRKNFTY